MRAALHDGATVVNVIEYDPAGNYTPPAGLEVAELGTEPVGIGWRVRGGDVYDPPPVETLTADPEAIAPDGAAASVVTYENTYDDAPVEVVFDVNGAQVTEAVVEGRAQVEVVTSTPGPITVTCEGLAVTVEATTEVPK